AFQHDFAARMDWTVEPARAANHNPTVVVNGRAGTEPIVLEARVDAPVVLDAAGTADPDGDPLRYDWFLYPEAGSGIPGQRVTFLRGPGALAPRVVIEGASGPRATVVPKVEGIAHVILAVEDGGEPSLTSYRRIIFHIGPPSADAEPPPRIALTFDDLPAHAALPPGLSRVDVARRILAALAAHHAPATYGFVNAKGLEGAPENEEVLRAWREAGHPLGNHT